MKLNPLFPMKFLSQLVRPLRSATRRSPVASALSGALPLALVLLPASLAQASANYGGAITYNGIAVPNVTVVFHTGFGDLTRTTGTDGKYVVPAVSPTPTDSGTITPTKAGYTFKTTSYTTSQGANGVYGFNTSYYGASPYLTSDDLTLNFSVQTGPKPTLDTISTVNGFANTVSPVGLTGITRGDSDLATTLAVTATSANTALVPNPVADYVYAATNTTCTLRMTPVPGQTGSTTITVTVTRSDNVTTTQTFTYNVAALNLPPVAGPATGMEFNGVNQYVDVPDGVWFGSTFTVEGWVYLKSYANWSRFFDFGNGAGIDNVVGALSQGGSGQPYFAIYQGANKNEFIGPNQIPLNTWTHLAFVREANGVATIYMNGALQNFANTSPPNNLNRTNNYIGRSNWGPDSYADGSFADFRIWNTGRTAAEIMATKGIALPPSTPGLVLNYRFNEGLGSTVTDLASLSANPDQGGAQNGQVVNEAVFLGGDSLLGRSVRFNLAASQRLVVTNFGALLGDSPITIEFWQKVDAAVQQSTFSLNNSAGKSVNAHVPWEDGRVYWDFGDINGNGRLSYLPKVPITGQWNHFAFVSDYANQVMKIYRNGVEEATQSKADKFLVHDGNLEIRPGGRVADFRIWNVARTATQINQNRFVPVALNSPGLLLNFLFSETSGAIVYDATTPAGTRVGGLINGPTMTAAVLQNLATNYVTPVPEDSTQLVYLPGGDRNSTPTYSSVTANNGTVTQLAGGNFLYRSNPNFSGSDAISYTVSDGTLYDTGTLKVQVNAVNDPPIVGSGTSLAFDGVDDFVDLPSQPLANNSFSVEFWARRTDTGSPDFVLGQGTTGAANQALHIGFRSQVFTFAFYGNDLNTPAYTDTDWHHWACTFDATTKARKIYRDGVVVAEDTSASNYLGTGNLMLGRNGFAADSYFKGSIADVRIWNTARTAAQVAGNMGPGLLNNSTGLLAYYRLNEGSGLTAFDSATGDGAQNGALKNGPVWWPVDAPANSLAFNGTSQYGQVLDNAAISLTGPLTAEAWVYPNAVGGADLSILNKFGVNDGGYGLTILAGSGKLYGLVTDKVGSGSSVSGNTAIPANTWTHVALRCDGMLLQVFVNGVLDGTTLVNRFPKDGTTPLYIGANYTGTAFLFNGRIGDIRLWNVARTDGEISAFRGGVPATTPGLVLNYRFTEGSGATLNDVATGDGAQNATLFGTPTWPAAETGLAPLQVTRYTEDTPITLTLPAFDVESASLTYSGASASSGSVSVVGNLATYTPAANYNGPVTITYTAGDGTTTLPGKLYLQGIPVEDGPTLDPIGNLVIGEGSPTAEIVLGLTDGDPELTQAMTITATSSNTNLIRNPTITYVSPAETARLAYKPRPGLNGTATITVVVTDLVSNLTATRQFNITVTAVDDPPNVGPATALLFNGANSVIIPAFGSSLPLNEITIEFWQNAMTNGQSSAFQLTPDDTANRLNVHVPWSDNRVYWDFGNINGEGRLVYTPPVSIVGSWQHFAFVASRSGNYMKIFRNGIEEATKPGVSTITPGLRDLKLGLMSGQLAEFRIWKVARTGDEILSTLHGLLPNDTTNLLAYYRFNQKPTTTLTDFASAANQGGSQDGVLVSDSADNDPIWRTATVAQPWQSSDAALKALQVMIVPDGSTNNVFLPAWDAENGLAVTWQGVTASTGTVTAISGGLYAYAAPKDYSGPATISYSVKDSSTTNAAVSGSVNLRVVVAQNDAPTISLIPNQAAEEDTALIEIPFTVDDDQPAASLSIVPVLLANPELIRSATVPGGGNFRTLNIVPQPGVIGTVHIRLLVTDQGNKSAQTEFDLRIESKPAFSVMDLGVLPGKPLSFGTALNDQGAVAGYVADTEDLESNPVGFYYRGLQNGGVVSTGNPLVQIGPDPLSSPFRVWALNNRYTLAGSGRSSSSTVPWVKGHEDDVTGLNFLLGGTSSVIRALNDAGTMVGTAVNSGGKMRAVSYSTGNPVATDLGVAPAPFNDQSEAFALNVSNHVVGAVTATDLRRRAAINQGSLFQPLFSVPDDTNSVANGINAFDQVVGRATVFAAGDSALNFDGVDETLTQTNLLINTNGVPLVAGNAAHTVEAWIKVNALPANRSWPLVLGNFVAGAHHWLVNSLASGGDLFVGIYNGAGVHVPVTVGAWMHVAVAYDPPSSKVFVYVNGQAFATNSGSGANLQGIPLSLGDPHGENYFNGALDEVRVWRTTRTAAQIAASYTQRLTGDETGLVVYYPFDEPTGATVTSLAPGALVATLAGSPIRVVRGGLPAPTLTVSDPALQFDGVSSLVSLPSLPLAGNSFTLEFWARRAESGGLDYVLGQGTNTTGSNGALHVGFRPENTFTFAFYGNDLNTTATYTDAAWHHWACTFDAGTKARKIYRDGVVVASDTASAAFQGTGPVLLGRAPWSLNSWFKGAVDDVRFWSVVRSADDIAANQNVRLAANTPGLLAHYLFDEGGGNTVVNHATGASDGSLQGAVGWIGHDSGLSRAFLYETLSGRLTSLGTVTGGGASVANAVNDFGQVAGTADKGIGQHAFFYSAGKMNDLNDLLPEIEVLDQWTLQSGAAINRSGAIVGTGSHNGAKRAFIALPATVIGRPVIQPQGATNRMPQITLLKTERADDTPDNSFYWSLGENRLYAIRPVTAKIEWFTSYDDIVGSGTNITSNTNRIVSVTVNVWPKQPTIHIAGAPVDLQPTVTAANYTFQSLIYVTNRASVEPSAKVFTSPDEGYSVAFYVKNDGLPLAVTQPPYFEVIRTVKWNDSHAKQTEAPCLIGQEVTDPDHAEYDGKNGYVLFEKAAYDAFGPDKAYDRGTRLGPILPVNLTKPGGNTNANPDDLVVVWYRTNRIGVAWASVPVRYSPGWPADDQVENIVIASQLGSGTLDDANYPARTIYNQPDITQPGFNPNEEHALMPVDVLYALRDDLNDTLNYSRPYALLKFRDPSTSRWRMRVFKVVAEQAPYFFNYAGTVGKEVQPPLPVSLLPLTASTYQQPANSQVAWEDYKGKFYARQAGADGTHTNLMIRWYYPMQPGFFHPDSSVAVGDPVAWLDRRQSSRLQSPNQAAGLPGTPIDVTYDIRWDDEPILEIGETLLHSKRGLPDVFNMASARVIFDSLNPQGTGGNSLTRFYDPISARTLRNVVIPPALLTPLQSQSINGKTYFTALPWMLKIRLSYDPVNQSLSFAGYLDENFGVGEPLLLPNVLSARERDRLKQIATGDGAWSTLIDRLYDLTRNPNQVDLLPADGVPDQALRLGLTTAIATNFYTISGQERRVTPLPAGESSTNWANVSYTSSTIDDAQALKTRLTAAVKAGTFIPTGGTLGATYAIGSMVVSENLGSGPKALTAGLGGIPAATVKPGNALSFDGTNGVVSVGSNQLAALDLTGTPFTIEFWAKVPVPTREQYLLGQPGGPADLGKLRIGFRDGGKFAFDLGTNAASVSIFNTSAAYTDTDWHHWAGTFDPETKIQTIYRDGLPVTSRTNAALNYVGFGNVELGRFGDGTFTQGTNQSNQYFAGNLDEIRVWKTARTGAEIRAQMNKRLLGSGVETDLEILYRCDEAAGPIASDALLDQDGYQGTFSGGVSLVPSDAPTGIPPRYVTIAENNDPALGGLPVSLYVIRVDDGPFLGDLKVLPGDNVFDERLTMRHSSDFGGDPSQAEFQWYYKPIGADFDPTDLPIVTDPTANVISGPNLRDWIPYNGGSGAGVNYITTGEGTESGLLTISDNAFICRYKGYAVNLNSAAAWSGWVGDPSGTPDQPRAALAEGWVKRVIRGLNPFDSRISDFHSSPAVTYASMLIQAGHRYEGPIAFNPSADAINKVGLIEAYTTVLERAKGLSIEGVPQVDFNPANNALLLAATKLSDLYTVLGNEAYADASDPTIGFGSGSVEYGSLASSIFAFQNQLDSLLEEELTLLRGRDDSAAGVGASPVYNRLFWNFTLGEGEVAYQQNYNISDQDQNGFIDEKDARILYPQGHGDAWGHYLMAMKQHYNLLRHPYFTWIPRSELVSVAGAAIKVDYLDERKFATVAAAKAKTGAEIVDLTYRLNYVDDPAGQWQGYKDTKTDRAWGVDEWARRAGMGAYFDWLAGNTILPSVDPNPAHTGIDKIDRQTVQELSEIPAQYDEIQKRLDQADAGLNPLGLAKGVVPFDIDPSLVSGAAGIAGKTHYEQIQDRALKAMQNALSVWDEVNKSTEALRKNQDSVEKLTANADDQERDYKNRLIEIYGYPYAGDIGAGKTYPNGYDGPDIYHYMYVPVPDFDGNQVTPTQDAQAYFTKVNFGINNTGDTTYGAQGSKAELFWFPGDFAKDLASSSDSLSVSNRILTVIYPQTTGDYAFNAPAAYGQRRAPGEIQLALSDMIQSEARLRAALKNDDALFADIDGRIELLNVRYQVRAADLQIQNKLAGTKGALVGTILGLKVAEAVLLWSGKTVVRTADAVAEALPKTVGLANDVTSVARSAIITSGAAFENANGGFAGLAAASALAIQNIGIPAAEGVAASGIATNDFRLEIADQVAQLERVMHELAASRLEGIRLAEALNQSAGRYQAALAKGQRLIEERVAFRIKTSAATTENRYQDMTFRVFRNDALQKYRATFDLAQRYVFLAATAYDYESNLLGTDTRSGRNFLTDIIRQRSLGQMLNGAPVIGRSGLADPLARMGNNFDVLKTQLGFNNPQTETGRFSLRNELFRLRDSSSVDWRAKLATLRVTNLWDIPEFRRYCRAFAPESAGPQPGLVIRFPTTVTSGQNFFTWPLGGGDSAYDSSRFATKIRSAGVWFTGYNGLGLSQTPRVYLIPAGSDVLSSPTPNDFVTRGWRVVDQALPVPFPIGANSLADPAWIPANDSLGGSFADIRRFSSFRAYHDSGAFNPGEVTSDSRLIGRSVWNTEWLLIIPGQTFLANPTTGLDVFLNSVSDIKLFFQTYSYSGN